MIESLISDCMLSDPGMLSRQDIQDRLIKITEQLDAEELEQFAGDELTPEYVEDDGLADWERELLMPPPRYSPGTLSSMKSLLKDHKSRRTYWSR